MKILIVFFLIYYINSVEVCEKISNNQIELKPEVETCLIDYHNSNIKCKIFTILLNKKGVKTPFYCVSNPSPDSGLPGSKTAGSPSKSG